MHHVAGHTSLLSCCRCDALVTETLSHSNGSSTIITVTLPPTDFANDNPFVTACSANSDPSVGMRICRNMLHLSIARAIATMSGLSGQFKNVRFSRRSRNVRFAPKSGQASFHEAMHFSIPRQAFPEHKDGSDHHRRR